jgi:serine/threonine-protein kinase RsbW
MPLLKNGEYKVTFPSNIKYLEDIERITSKITAELNFEESVRDDLSIAVTELFNNALHHGNKEDESKKITVTFRIGNNKLSISVQDEGKGFEPEKLRDPLLPENIYDVSGRGIYLVKQLVDDLKFNITDKGTEIIIIKKLPHPKDIKK